MKFDHRFSLIEAAPGHRVYGADGVIMRLDFLPHMLRVALVRDGVPLVRKVMRICLTFDHRVMDGAQAAKFNLSVREYLEHPESLFTE